jgi:alpha-beta hydrolase superfamily lysophospholipase
MRRQELGGFIVIGEAHARAIPLEFLAREAKSYVAQQADLSERPTVRPVGAGFAAFAKRVRDALISILPEVSTWRAPTLVLHGGEDFLVSVQQANVLRDSLEAAKTPYRFVLYPENGHRLPPEDVRKKATAFFAENSGSACGTDIP